ncbi:SIR2 family protein [Levilactobacillus parabrevis]|uniref:SIR2 family protein n=1 Tax=Levilactobacillus parabrevis TaxID=357278 RepID=UPI00375675F9
MYKPQQLNEIRENAINLIKINGDLDSYESIIITKKELQTHKIKHHLFFDFLTKELTTDTFLFVGYSFKDDLVLKNIAELREVLGEYAPIHYSIQKQVDPKKTFEFKMQQYELKSLKKNYGIETYLVENYEEIPKVINRIRDVQIKHNVFISASLWAPSNDEDNFSYRLTQALADKLIDNKFNIYNGLGKRIGGYLTGAAFQYLQQSHTPMITSRLRIEPFKVKDTESEKNEFRDSIISDFKIFIFMFGDAKSDQPVTKSGVYNEYLRAYKYYGTRAIYVPIPWTGYAAKAVFDNMCKSIDQFPYLRNMQKKFNDFPSASMMTSIVSGKDKTIDTWIDEVVDSTINALNSGVEYIDSFPLNQ